MSGTTDDWVVVDFDTREVQSRHATKEEAMLAAGLVFEKPPFSEEE